MQHQRIWLVLTVLLLLFTSIAVASTLHAQPAQQADNASVTPKSGSSDTAFAFYASGYTPYEPIGIRIHAPDGSVSDVFDNMGQKLIMFADGDGTADWIVVPHDQSPGKYVMVAAGSDSGTQRIIPFEISR